MRKRSSYRPRNVLLDNMAWVKGGMTPVRVSSHNTTLRIRNHGALASMAKGTGTREDADLLIAAFNMAQGMVCIQLGRDWSDELLAASNAVLTMARRGVERGRFLFTGPELVAVNLGMEIHVAQLDACTVGELERAMDIVHKTIAAKKARKIVEVAHA